MEMSKTMFFGAALMMFMPILMLLVTVYFEGTFMKWTNVIVAGFLFLLNIAGIASYKSFYDQFLIGLSLLINVLTILTVLKL
jgi:hypothetical protein